MVIAELPVCMQFPWTHLLGYLGHRLVPEFEWVDASTYRRRSAMGVISVTFDADKCCLRISAEEAAASAELPRRVADLFAIDHDARAVTAHLSRSKELVWRLSAVPGMRPVGAWAAFELCVRTVIGQQVTVAAARTLMQRVVQRCAEVTPERLLACDLSNIGMPGKRVQTLLALAGAVVEQRVQLQQPWIQVNAALQGVPGFGPWTRAYLAIRLGREADAFPETDLGLVRAARADSPKALLARAEAWRPYRAYAATYLWSVSATQPARSS
jgi:3-methyladenine DNA glycosylase/8-oxoguanine DNA glycosylase